MNNYRRGARQERVLQRMFEEEGFFVVRSAASKSPVDLLAFSKTTAPVFIQVKRTRRQYPTKPAWDEKVVSLPGIRLEWWCWVGGLRRWAIYLTRGCETRGPFYMTTKQAKQYIANQDEKLC